MKYHAQFKGQHFLVVFMQYLCVSISIKSRLASTRQPLDPSYLGENATPTATPRPFRAREELLGPSSYARTGTASRLHRTSEAREWSIMFHVYWPACAALTMVVLGVIVVILKYGNRLCKVRHTTNPTEDDWEDKAYDQKISFAWKIRRHIYF